jgi:hypothetical protein
VVPVSSLLNPVGPEEPSVYWRRRAIIGVGLLVVLWLVWWLFSSVFGGTSAPEDQQVPPPTSSAPASPRPSPSSSPSPSASAKPQAKATSSSPSPTAKAKAAPKPARCGDGDILVAVAPAQRTGEVGAGMKITMTVTNTGVQACRRDVGDPANEVRVVSGRVLVWSSNFCRGTTDGRSEKAGVVTLKPKESWSTTVRWPGKVTLSSCPATQPVAKAGTYRAQGINNSRWSRESTFTLR